MEFTVRLGYMFLKALNQVLNFCLKKQLVLMGVAVILNHSEYITVLWSYKAASILASFYYLFVSYVMYCVIN